MIQTKEDLIRYLECDRIARGETKTKPSLIRDSLWRFQITYRKCEYYSNNRASYINKLLYMVYYCLYKDKCKKLCSEIPLNCIEEGLVIWHGQNIIINGNSKIGKNFSISAGCCVGQAHDKFPVIGDNVEMTIGSKVIGGITIAHDTTIGAGAVVVKSITEPYTTVGGVPAVCISRNNNTYVSEKKERLQQIINLEQ